MTDDAVRDPDAALAASRALLAGRGVPVEQAVAAWHVAARARVERGELVFAQRAARAGLARAERAGLDEQAAALRLTLAWIHQERGDPAACGRLLDQLMPTARGELLARARFLRGVMLCVLGRHEQAVSELTAAVAGLSRAGSRHWLANALVGRGVARGYLHRLAGADRDLVRAGRIYTELGERERAAMCLHNRGFVAMQAGDVPLALARFDEAVAAGLRVDGRPETRADLANALLAAGLVTEAGQVLAEAARSLGNAGRARTFAEASLALGRFALQAGDLPLALASAQRARRLFDAQRRPSWSAAASALELRIGLRERADLVPAARLVAARCEPVQAAELRLAAAAKAGPVVARRLLEQVRDQRGRGPALLRAMGWLAAARLATDHRAVLAACRAGLSVVARQASVMGAVEARAAAMELATELASTGLAEAVRGGRPATVLRWIERHRASTLAVAPIRPATGLASGLGALRNAERTHAVQVGDLEVRVRSLSARTTGDRAPAVRGPAVEEVAAALGEAALLSFARHGDRLVAVSVVDGRARLHRLGNALAVQDDVDALRLAYPARTRTAVRAARRIDHALLGPLAGVVGDRELVVVPTGGLHALTMAALPSCLGRPVTVAPSVSLWLRAMRAAPTRYADPVWVAGPGLSCGVREANGLHRRWGGTLLTGRAATAEAVLAAMDGAGLVHVAAHGQFRDDAPLLSSLLLADGPLYGYDVERLRRAPALAVLSACEVARSAVRGLDDPLGLATVLLRGGSCTVIASTVPVVDEAAVGLVTELHRHLRAGAGPALALARAQVAHGDQGFICLGAGLR